MNQALFNRMIKPFRDRLLLVLSKGLLESADDSKKMQLVKVSMNHNELKDSVEHIHDYGLSSKPPAGSEALIGCIGGDRDNAVAIKVGNASYRIKDLDDGEVALYSMHGQVILLKSDGSISITPKSGAATDINSDLNVNGNIKATLEVSAMNMVPAVAVKLSTHIHGTGVGPSVNPTPGS